MNKILRLSYANIRKHKKESILLGILILFSMILIASSASSIVGINKITPNMVRISKCYKNFVEIKQEDYKNQFLSYFEDNPEVAKFDHVKVASGTLKIVNDAHTGKDKQYDMSFVSEPDEKLLENFRCVESMSEEERLKLKHPIFLDKSNQKSLNLSVGDTLTLKYEKKEFEYTVAGFYESGLWMMGTKAVVSRDDLAYLEEYVDRYEVIAFNTNDGADTRALLKDFEEFAKENSVNDINGSLISNSYEDIVTTNSTNMSLLSIIIAIMAGLIVIAVIIMIRFRIVSDISEQLVSIGVLEAIGYKSAEIALSYICEYLLIALVALVLSVAPTVLLTGFLLDNAALTIHYGGEHIIPVVPILISMIVILLFIGIVALTKALSVRKYPPVLAFRKGINTHHFKKTFFPLEKTRGNVHIRLALKGFMSSLSQNIGLTVCITAATVMVISSFVLGSFFSNEDRILNSVCGHELADIRMETVGSVDKDAFVQELTDMSEVDKVLLATESVSVTFPDRDITASLEVYEDYSETSTIVLIEGRLPKHDNEISVTSQLKGRLKVKLGDTIRVEYGKVVRDYVICGFVNSVINPSTAYMTTNGFKIINPTYTPDVYDIYLNKEVDTDKFTDMLNDRYGDNVADISNSETSGDSYIDRIKSAARIKMAKAMLEEGVSYMEYSIRVGDEVITDSTSTMKIKSLTHTKNEYREMAAETMSSFAAVAVIMMVVAAMVVTIILSILMASNIRKQYKEIGIMKALGYTSRELKFQMAARIIPPTIFAIMIGSALSILFLGVIEMFVAKVSISIVSIIIVDILVLLFCFVSAYRAAGKIGKISVYELMTE